MGSGGRSLARAARASSRMGTTVWSRYCLVGKPFVSSADLILFAGGGAATSGVSLPDGGLTSGSGLVLLRSGCGSDVSEEGWLTAAAAAGAEDG